MNGGSRAAAVVLVGLGLVGCQLGSKAAPGSSPTTGRSGEPEPLEADVVVGPGDFDFPETTAGLDSLASYRAVLTVKFQGTRAGQPAPRTARYEFSYSSKPLARLLTITTTGSQPDSTKVLPVLAAETDGAAYQVEADGSCQAAALDTVTSMARYLEPARMLLGVFGAEPAGPDRYRFDERALARPGLTKATGELTVAPQGFLTKYTVTAEADDKFLGAGGAGTISWSYEVRDVNRPVSVKLPSDCPAGLVDAPVMPTASKVVRTPGLLAYLTTSPLAEAAAFYRDTMPGLGWKADRRPLVRDSVALLEFTSAGRTMTVVATPAATGTSVQVTVDRVNER